MRFRLFLSLALAILGVTSARYGFAQNIYAAREGHLPIAIGFGVSNFDLDYGNGRTMEGITTWLDWSPPVAPRLLTGIGLEFEGRDINFGRPSSLPRMRQDTAAGGVYYRWPHFRVVHPYATFLMGMGSIDFPHKPPYTHDTRAIYEPGGGLEVRVFRSVWVRGAYEYQFWPHLLGPHALNPNGITFGTSYDFRPRPGS